jgi:hypothetical protein
MRSKHKLISDLHFPLWLLKDLFWMADLPILSLILAIPAILISIFMCMMTAGKPHRENKMVLWWLIANTMWMCSEKFEVNTMWLAFIFFTFGIIEIILYINYLLKNKQYE